MRLIKMAALGVLAMGISSHAAYTNYTTGIRALAAEPDNGGYQTGMGLDGFISAERGMGNASGGLGLRAHFQNYQAESGTSGGDIQESGVALTALGGPNAMRFQPRFGGHVGYARQEDANFLELGPDVTASLLLTPNVGLNALVTPVWFINEDETAYHDTKFGLGVSWSIPGG